MPALESLLNKVHRVRPATLSELDSAGLQLFERIIFFCKLNININVFYTVIYIQCLHLFNKKFLLIIKIAGLGSKQKNFQQLPSNLSERNLFAVWKIRQFFSRNERTDRLDPLPLFVFGPPSAPSKAKVFFEWSPALLFSFLLIQSLGKNSSAKSKEGIVSYLSHSAGFL